MGGILVEYVYPFLCNFHSHAFIKWLIKILVRPGLITTNSIIFYYIEDPGLRPYDFQSYFQVLAVARTNSMNDGIFEKRLHKQGGHMILAAKQRGINLATI